MRPHFYAAIGAALCILASTTALAQSNDGAQKHSDEISKKIQAGSFTPRIFVRDEYKSAQSGGYTNLLVPLVEFPLRESLALRLEVPIVTANPYSPGSDTDTGIGDITTRLSWTVASEENYAVVVGSEFIFDSATEDSLGSGKNVIAPIAFASIKVPRLNSMLFPFVEYYHTVSGDYSRPDVNYTVFKPVVFTRLPSRFYTIVEPAIYVDHERNDRVGMNVELELGRFVTTNTMVYGRPGVGLFGDNLPQVYNWNFEVGFRYFFK